MHSNTDSAIIFVVFLGHASVCKMISSKYIVNVIFSGIILSDFMFFILVYNEVVSTALNCDNFFKCLFRGQTVDQGSIHFLSCIPPF